MTAVRVRVPASTSNLGGGFDCVGIAVDRWLQVDARVSSSVGGGAAKIATDAVRFTRSGTASALAGTPSDDLIYRGFTIACGAAGREVPREVAFDVDSSIPVGRGFGSSAAALLAGAAAANALLALGIPDEVVAKLCAEVEGHGDNVGPCLLGGAVFAMLHGERGLVLAPMAVHPSLRLAFAIPDFAVDTHLARAALPGSIGHRDARAAAAASAALVLGLERGDPELLTVGLEGPLHIPYRRELVRGYDDVVEAARSAGAIGATLSGSGSAIVAIADSASAEGAADAMAGAWSAHGVAAMPFVSAPCSRGLHIVRPGEGDSVSGTSAEQSAASHISSNTR
ncbi:MAG TPA: homoserine kinase [Gemmatimonadaceae bacterium]|nr:homoserine kinase [Gemmatimonadaceae bacterium]